jgi:hypothetical protein
MPWLGKPRWDAGAGEFLGDDAGLEDVRRGPIPSIFLRDGPRGVTMGDQQFLPGYRFC